MKEHVTEWLEEIDSTNSEALRRLPELDNLSVLAAVLQTAGRGQRGNSWLTRGGENLTFSMVARPGLDGIPAVPAREQFNLSIAATLAVRDYLTATGIDARIKWPNDIYVRSRKICGMLLENTLSESDVAACVIGIGLNVNQKDFPPQLINPTSMTLLTGVEYDLRPELERLCRFLAVRLRSIGEPSQHEEYLSALFRKDTFNEYVDCKSGSIFTARIKDVTPEGLLVLEVTDGSLRRYSFKEVSYII